MKRKYLKILNMNDDDGKFLSRQAVLKMLSISKSTFYQWTKRGLPVIRIGRLVFVEKSDLEKFLRKHKT